MKDHYTILGLTPEAEPIVIQAAYRALALRYHPDRNPTGESASRMAAINAAYEVLSDSSKRRQYDESRSFAKGPQIHNAFENNAIVAPQAIERAWNIAVDFTPEIAETHRSLHAISQRLGVEFKIRIVDSKDFEHASNIADKMKRDYLAKHFGEDIDVCGLGEALLVGRHFDAAQYLKEVIDVLGRNIWRPKAEEAIGTRFPGVIESCLKRHLLKELRETRGHATVSTAVRLVELHGGTAKCSIGFFHYRITGRLHDHEFSFGESEAFRTFVISKLDQSSPP